jgi:hypothetical protein
VVGGDACKAEESYKALLEIAQAKYPKKAGKIEAHHVEPKYLGGAKNGLTMQIDSAYHQLITNAIRKQLPYGYEYNLTPQIREALNLVYKDYPLPGVHC